MAPKSTKRPASAAIEAAKKRPAACDSSAVDEAPFAPAALARSEQAIQMNDEHIACNIFGAILCESAHGKYKNGLAGVRCWLRQWIKDLEAGKSRMLVMYFRADDLHRGYGDSGWDHGHYKVLEKALVNRDFAQLRFSVEEVRVQSCGDERRVKVADRILSEKAFILGEPYVCQPGLSMWTQSAENDEESEADEEDDVLADERDDEESEEEGATTRTLVEDGKQWHERAVSEVICLDASHVLRADV